MGLRSYVRASASPTFELSLVVGILAGGYSVLLKWLDVEHGFLKEVNPDLIVFSGFVTFASLVAAFRTSHALSRYLDGASLMYKMSSGWFDAMSQLVTFTRHSPVAKDKVQEMHEVLIRLFSLINALCLDGLENKKSPDKVPGHTFEIIGWTDLREDMRDDIMASSCKVEYVFQALHQLIADAVEEKVLVAAPPLLTRVFAEMGAGLTTYHEAKKLSGVPLPFAYSLITRIILFSEFLFVPAMLAQFTKGYAGAFTFSMGATTLLWFLNSVAENLDNPYRKDSSTLNTDDEQQEYNLRLRQVLDQASSQKPSLVANWRDKAKGNRASITVTELKKSYGEGQMARETTPVDVVVSEPAEENPPKTKEAVVTESADNGVSPRGEKRSGSYVGGFWSCCATDSTDRKDQVTKQPPDADPDRDNVAHDLAPSSGKGGADNRQKAGTAHR